MKRDNYLAYGHNINVANIIANEVQPEKKVELEKVEKVSPADAFLRLVYALDPISNLPTGDLCYMVSDKANPEVKAWVLQNIQMDTSSAANMTAPDGLSDDDLITLTRKQGESTEAYAERVNIFFQNNKAVVEDGLSRAKRYVSSEPETTSVSTE